jgi:hypothetical protein
MDMKKKKWMEIDDLFDINRFKNARFSKSLISQIESGYNERTLHVHMIFDAVKSLESPKSVKNSAGKTKPEKKLKGALKGFKHKHFMQPYFIAENIKNQWENNPNKNSIMDDFLKNVDADEETIWKAAGLLAHNVVQDGYFQRANENKLTGEWIVYKEYDGIRYYLLIANHVDRNSSEEKKLETALYQVLKADFPEVEI